ARQLVAGAGRALPRAPDDDLAGLRRRAGDDRALVLYCRAPVHAGAGADVVDIERHRAQELVDLRVQSREHGPGYVVEPLAQKLLLAQRRALVRRPQAVEHARRQVRVLVRARLDHLNARLAAELAQPAGALRRRRHYGPGVGAEAQAQVRLRPALRVAEGELVGPEHRPLGPVPPGRLLGAHEVQHAAQVVAREATRRVPLGKLVAVERQAGWPFH